MPDPSIIAAGIQAGGNAVNGLIDVAYREATYFRNKRDIIEAEQRQNEEWQRRFDAENAFNHPSMQAQRLKEAGINPIQALSGSSPTPSASGSTNDVNSPQGQPFESGFGSGIAEIYLAGQRVRNETKVADAQADLLKAEAAKTRTDESMAYWEQQWKSNEDARQERLVSLKEKLGNEEWRISKIEADLAEYTFENKKAMSDQEVEQMYLDYAIGIWQIEHTKQGIVESQAVVQDYADQAVTRAVQRELMKSNIEVNEHQCKELVSRCAKMDEETKLILKQQGKTDAEIAKIQAEAQQIEAYTKEIPKNAKAQRYNTYVNGTVNALANAASSAARLVGVVPELFNLVTNPASTS